MTSQHVVQFDEALRLTRLPPGRAEGRIWLNFVLSGLGWNHAKDDPGKLRWNLGDHIEVIGDHGPLECLGGNGSSDGRLNHMSQEIRDDGSNRLTIEYRQGDTVLDAEIVDLPGI